MKFSLRYFLLLSSIIFSFGISKLYAYIVASASQTSAIDFQKETHILVSGYDKVMAGQFVTASVSSGIRLKEVFPDRQVIFIVDKKDLKHLQPFSWMKIISDNEESLVAPNLIKLINKFKVNKISSLEFFTHSSMHIGAGLTPDTPTSDRFGHETPNLKTIKDKFTQDGYIFFHGCNMGLNSAVQVSRILEMPVLAATTSTDFSELHVNNEWYVNNPKSFPQDIPRSKLNSISYTKPYKCNTNVCRKMRPDNHKYNGHWGSYSGGLPFYKMFCNYEADESHCKKVMALSLFGWQSSIPVNKDSPVADLKIVAQDFLCPTDVTHAKRKECIDALNNKEILQREIYSPFEGNSLDCNFKGCNVVTKCKYDSAGNAIVGSCTVSTATNKNPTTLIREYKNYLEGFELLD